MRVIDLTANLYFGIGSTLFLALIITWITTRVVEPLHPPAEGAAS